MRTDVDSVFPKEWVSSLWGSGYVTDTQISLSSEDFEKSSNGAMKNANNIKQTIEQDTALKNENIFSKEDVSILWKWYKDALNCHKDYHNDLTIHQLNLKSERL